MSRYKKCYAHISIGKSEFKIEFNNTPKGKSDYRFMFNYKSMDLDKIRFDQFWIPIPNLYKQRKKPAVIFDPIIDFYWKCARIKGTHHDPGVLETYLLAKILPHARNNKSRKVFKDAIPQSNQSKDFKEIQDLNQSLTDSSNQTVSELIFWEQTGKILGPPEYEPFVHEKYNEMTGPLFQEAHEAIDHRSPDIFESFEKKWLELIKKYGKQSGYELEKLVLDILSYESRAQVHRCYSWFWTAILPAMGKWFSFNDEAQLFHNIWHLSPICESSENGSPLHLFHGHVFALHPAGGLMLKTSAGRGIMEDFLTSKTNNDYERLLNALLISVFHYENIYSNRIETQGSKTETITEDIEYRIQQRDQEDEEEEDDDDMDSD